MGHARQQGLPEHPGGCTPTAAHQQRRRCAGRRRACVRGPHRRQRRRRAGALRWEGGGSIWERKKSLAHTGQNPQFPNQLCLARPPRGRRRRPRSTVTIGKSRRSRGRWAFARSGGQPRRKVRRRGVPCPPCARARSLASPSREAASIAGSSPWKSARLQGALADVRHPLLGEKSALICIGR